MRFMMLMIPAVYQQDTPPDFMPPADAVRYAFATVGTALWVTSLVLIVGFGILTFSHFAPNAAMGLLTAITLALALAADFLFLPPLLIAFGGNKP